MFSYFFINFIIFLHLFKTFLILAFYTSVKSALSLSQKNENDKDKWFFCANYVLELRTQFLCSNNLAENRDWKWETDLMLN